MKRLVYSPSINAWIKTDNGVFDLSPYIVGCTIDRRINSVSYAQIEFRNPKITDPDDPKRQRFLFTDHPRSNSKEGIVRGPMFHPMDPIIITMTRLKGRPIQVFTGYCDTVPYVQLYPGTASLTASCTLKRLQYTYWDPALPFVRQWMEKIGWAITKDGIAFNAYPQNSGNLNDSSFGYLLYKVLEEIGGWDKDDIFIQELPGAKINKIVAKLYEDTAKEQADSIKEFHSFLYEILGAARYGSAGGTGPTTPASFDSTPSSGGTGWVRIGATEFSDSGVGASGRLGQVGGVNFAELGTATRGGVATNIGWIAKAFGDSGELPMLQKLEIRYKGKSVIGYKTDRGYGQGGNGINSDPTWAIDLWSDAAQALNFSGKDYVEVRKVR